jgi:hypothetical protein
MSVLTTLRNPNSISSIKHSYSYLFCRHIINFFLKDFPLKTMRNIQKVVIKISDAIFSFYVLSLVCPITPQNSIHISSICFCSVCFKYKTGWPLSIDCMAYFAPTSEPNHGADVFLVFRACMSSER